MIHTGLNCFVPLSPWCKYWLTQQWTMSQLQPALTALPDPTVPLLPVLLTSNLNASHCICSLTPPDCAVRIGSCFPAFIFHLPAHYPVPQIDDAWPDPCLFWVITCFLPQLFPWHNENFYFNWCALCSLVYTHHSTEQSQTFPKLVVIVRRRSTFIFLLLLSRYLGLFMGRATYSLLWHNTCCRWTLVASSLGRNFAWKILAAPSPRKAHKIRQWMRTYLLVRNELRPFFYICQLCYVIPIVNLWPHIARGQSLWKRFVTHMYPYALQNQKVFGWSDYA